MNLQITKSFKDDDSPRPFLVGELVTVSKETGEAWIAAGRAIPHIADVARSVTSPTRRKLERAVKG